MYLGPKPLRELSVHEHCKGTLVGGLVKSFSNTILLRCVGSCELVRDAFFSEVGFEFFADELATTIRSDGFHTPACESLEALDEGFNEGGCIIFML